MTELELSKHPKTGTPSSYLRVKHRNIHHVLVCVDASPTADAVLAHAAAVAMAADGRMTVMRVLETAPAQTPTDPVEWTLRHRDVEAALRERTSYIGDVQSIVADGPAAERICAWARDNTVDLTVLGRGGDGSWPPFIRLGGTARRVTEAVNGSVLIVPASQDDGAPIRYRKVLTPLDGSARSECVLKLGLAIAEAHNADMLLVHAVPNVDITEAAPLDAETITLRDQLRRRNERAAERYLNGIRSRLPRAPRISIRVLSSGDPRHALARVAAEEHADLMVLSSTGQGGHSDMSLGSVADYLINHMNIPVLLVRESTGNPGVVLRKPDGSGAVRLPSRALM